MYGGCTGWYGYRAGAGVNRHHTHHGMVRRQRVHRPQPSSVADWQAPAPVIDCQVPAQEWQAPAPATEWQAQTPVAPRPEPGSRPRTTTRLVRAGVLILCCAFTLMLFATKGFGLFGDDERDEALSGCRFAVSERLNLPASAQFAGLTVLPGTLSVFDTADLNADYPALDQDAISHVMHVTGSVIAENQNATMVQSTFSCKAVFVDGKFSGATTNIRSQLVPSEPAWHI